MMRAIGRAVATASGEARVDRTCSDHRAERMPWEDKLALDVQYVDTQSFWLDIKLLLKTPLVVLTSSGFRRSGEATKFND